MIVRHWVAAANGLGPPCQHFLALRQRNAVREMWLP